MTGHFTDDKMTDRPKISNLRQEVRQCAEDGNYVLLKHARERGFERGITEPEWLYVLRNGWHEKRKDQYDDFHESWSYSIRGKTVDERELRVIVSFDDDPQMLIVTLIDLSS